MFWRKKNPTLLTRNQFNALEAWIDAKREYHSQPQCDGSELSILKRRIQWEKYMAAHDRVRSELIDR